MTKVKGVPCIPAGPLAQSLSTNATLLTTGFQGTRLSSPNDRDVWVLGSYYEALTLLGEDTAL